MPMTASVRRSPRDAILAAALENFRAEGPRGFTMSGVANIARVTTPAIYRHFSGKEELLSELVNQGFDLFLQYLTRCLVGKTPRERLMLVADAYLDFAIEHPRHYETIFMTAEIPGFKRFPDDFRAGRSASFQFLVDRVRECIDAGILKKGDAVDVSLTLWAQSHGFVSLYLMGRFGKDLKAVRTEHHKTLARLFAGLDA